MADNELKNFNVVVVGPDMIAGQGPTVAPSYRLPEPGPDSKLFEDKSKAPGYKFGSYLNVYNFDAAISKILGCDEWSLCQKPITREIWDCGCLVEEIIGYEDFLLIDNPEENNIPRNVSVLLQDGMVKGGDRPLDPDDENVHYHYDPTGNEEDKFRGWWISDELEEILKEKYGWNFYTNVSIESGYSYPNDVDGVWQGGVEKTLLDIEFHDLDFAIDDNITLPGEPDTRAKGDRFDILALFSYAVLEEALNALESATAALTGDCDQGYGAEITWDTVISINPDAEPKFYSILVQKEPESEKELLAEVQHIDCDGACVYNYEFDESYQVGIPTFPKYFIYWTATDGSKSPEIELSKSPNGFVSYGIPACSEEDITLTLSNAENSGCFEENYGIVNLSWTIPVPENSNIGEIRLKKTRNGATEVFTLEGDVRSYADEDAKYDSTNNEITYNVEADIVSLVDGEVSQMVISNDLSHQPLECDCQDVVVDTCLDKCWVKKILIPGDDDEDDPHNCNGGSEPNYSYPAELLIWLENYTEDPFKNDEDGNPDPSATFDIKYCIKDPCTSGVDEFSIRLKLPNKMNIQNVTTNYNDGAGDGVEYGPDFLFGERDGEWVIESDANFTRTNEVRGTLCTVRVDRPIGNERISFIISDSTNPEVDGSSVVTEAQNGTPQEYNWSNNYQNKSTGSSIWQAGPPLSVCTGEIDMGYGDYLIDVKAVDMDTFDVNMCLSRDGFDTFFLVVINTDFKTEIASIDQVVGQAVNAGWSVTHQNILPGMSIIMGHGQKPIYSAGYETLLRAELTDTAIKFNEDNETCVCVFPFFFKLGGLFDMIGSMTSGFGDAGYSNVTQSSSGNSGFAMMAGDPIGAAASSMVSRDSAASNTLVNGMTNIASNIDPRFKEIVDCLKCAFINALEDFNDPEKGRKYSQEDIFKIILLIQLFLMIITIFSTISISKNDEINQILDGIEELGESICSNSLAAVVTQENGDNSELNVKIKYCIPAGDVVGIQFEVDIPEGYTINMSDKLPGDAKSQQFLQCLNPSGKYLCVYDYKLGSSRTENYQALSTDRGASCDGDLPTLTEFNLVWTGDGSPPAGDAIEIGFIEENVKMVTNTVRTNPAEKWDGNWFDTDDEVNIRDFLVSCILQTGAEVDLSAPDLSIVLPNNNTVSQEYFGGSDPGLSGISYDTTTWYGRGDEGGTEYKLDHFDANGVNNGKPDITDVVTVRNLFTKLGRTRIKVGETSRVSAIVPQEVCVAGDGYDFEFYIPDECSNFCIKPQCFSKVWISDVIINTGEEGTPKDILLEISYSTDCIEDEETGIPTSLSGVQFQIGGLGGEGILSSINGRKGKDQKTGTAIRNYDWNYHIATSSKNKKVKDTFIAYAQSKDGYIPNGKGVLTYLRVNPSSISGLTSLAASDRQFTYTNGYKLKNHSQDAQVVNEFAGAPPTHPMASLHAMIQNSNSLITMQRFGIGIVSHTTTTSDLCEDVSPDYEKDKVSASRAVKLISKRIYDSGFDANEDKELNIIDVQTAFHVNNMDSFFEVGEGGEYPSEIVPVECCICPEPGEFKLIAADFNAELDLKKISGWGRDATISVDSFRCGESFEGGIILAWTPSEKSKYYVVYRKRRGSDERPIPVIASKNGVVDASKEFHGTKKASSEAINKHPRQLGSSTIWVDFPPSGINDCCDWCEDDPDCDPKNQVEEYEYYVVAVNECGASFSNKAFGEIECCDFAPKALDELIVVEGNFDYSSKKSYIGEFDILTHSKKPGRVFTFTDGERTQSGGTIKVGGGAPKDSLGNYGVPNDFSYIYTPPPNFLGRDKISYYAFLETKDRRDWRDWCYDEGVVNILVYPANPEAKGKSGDCGDSDERGGAILSWNPITGVSGYRVYRDGSLIAELDSDVDSYIDIPPNAEELQENCGEEDIDIIYSVTSVYIVEGQEFEGKPEKNEFKVTIECCAEIPPVEIIINTEGNFCNELGDTRQAEEVEISWIDLGDFDEYRVYRRGPYEELDTPTGDWVLIGAVAGQPDAGGMHRFVDSLVGCEGCGMNAYDYYVSVFTASGEGEEAQAVKQLSFECCEVAPVARDQEFTVERGKNLIDKQLLAFDADVNIDKYELVSEPSDEAGYVYEFNEDDGTFSFQPAYLYYGPAQFKWKVTDTCGNSDTAIVTLWVEGEDFCNEDNYIICNAALTYLTDQQDKKEARQKIDELPQVPFFLNNKGVPSLRKRCGAYSVAQSIDPSLFGLPQEGCGYYTTGTGGGLIIPSISFSCIDEINFGICKPNNGTGVPSIDLEIQCLGGRLFSTCTDAGGGSGVGSIFMECTNPELFSEECLEGSSSAAGSVEMDCGNDQQFHECDEVATDEAGEVELDCGNDQQFHECDEVATDEAGEVGLSCDDEQGLSACLPMEPENEDLE